MSARDALLILLSPEIGTDRAEALINDLVTSTTVRGRERRADLLTAAARRVANLPTANDGRLIAATRDQILAAITADPAS